MMLDLQSNSVLLLCSNNKFSTFIGSSDDLKQFKTLSARLNFRSDGADVAGITWINIAII